MSMTLMEARAVAHTEALASRAVEHVSRRIDSALLRYDAWYVVLLAVILAFAVIISAGLAIWCVVAKNKRFTSNWSWSWTGVSINVECV